MKGISDQILIYTRSNGFMYLKEIFFWCLVKFIKLQIFQNILKKHL